MAARQASLFITNSQSSLRLTSIESVAWGPCRVETAGSGSNHEQDDGDNSDKVKGKSRVSERGRQPGNPGKQVTALLQKASQSKSWPQVAGHAFSPVEQLGSHRLFGSAQRKTGSRCRGFLHSFHTMHCAGPQTARHNLATEHDTARCNTRAQSLTCVRLFVVPWAGAPQAPLSTGGGAWNATPRSLPSLERKIRSHLFIFALDRKSTV